MLVYSNYINFINLLKMGNDSLLAYENCLSLIDVANHFCNKNYYSFFNPNNSKNYVTYEMR